MGWFALAGMAISTVMSAKSQQQQGAAQEQAAYAQASQEDTQAAQTQAAGYQQARRIREQGATNQSSATASLASSGVDVSQGTAADIRQKIGQNTEEDAMNTILNSDQKATTLREQAATDRSAGDQAAQAAHSNVLTSLLKGGSSIASGWKSSAQ